MSIIEYNSSWPLAEFKDVAKVVTGSTPSTKKPEYHGGDIPFVKPGDLKEEGIVVSDAENYVTELGAEQGRLLPAKSVMVCCIGSLGKVGYSTKPLITNQQINSLVFDESKVYSRYGYYYCTTILPILEHIAPNTTVAIVNKTNFSKLKIPLPPLETQKRIAAVLDKADTLRQKRRQTIDKLDELTQSVFLDMFGDPKINPKGIDIGKLGDYARIEMGQSPKGSTYNEEGKGVPLLNGPTEFGLKYPTEKQWTTEPKKFAERNDILFCVRGATAGRLNRANKKYCIGRGLAAIKGEAELETEFIYYVLESFYEHFQSKGQGSTFINISKSDLNKLEIPIPDQIEQGKFVKIAAHIEENKSKLLKSESKLNDLFNSLLQKAFKGELNFSDSDEALLAAEAEGEYSV